jgi:AcrR family transcriptional regulator
MSPRSPEQNLAQRERTRERILEHALGLFSRRGFDATSVRMIADSAGVAHGLLYSYFPSKEALLHAIFERSMRDVRESFALADDAAAPAEKIGQLIRGGREILRRNLEFWRLAYSVRGQRSVLEGLGPALADWTRSVVRTLESYCREAGTPNPPLDAAVLFGAIDGVHQHFVLDPEHYPLDAVTDELIVLFERATGRG